MIGKPLILAKRQFLRAYVRSEAGIDRNFTNRQAASLMSSLGYRTTETAFKDAARPRLKFEPHSVTRTPETLEFMRIMEKAFPGFRRDELLVTEPVPTAPRSTATG